MATLELEKEFKGTLKKTIIKSKEQLKLFHSYIKGKSKIKEI